jgi:hypothetical protein
MSEDDPASKAALELFKNDLQHHETLSGFTSAQIQTRFAFRFFLMLPLLVRRLLFLVPRAPIQRFLSLLLGLPLLHG